MGPWRALDPPHRIEKARDELFVSLVKSDSESTADVRFGGAVLYHCFCQGEIQLPPERFFPIRIASRLGLFGIGQQTQPLRILDFDNEIVECESARSRIEFKSEIELSTRHLLSVKTGRKGKAPGWSAAFDSDKGKLCVEAIPHFEFLFRMEVPEPDAPDIGPAHFIEAIRKFLFAYRFVTKDVSLPVPDLDRGHQYLAISVAKVAYSQSFTSSGALQRLSRIKPGSYSPEIVRYETARRAGVPPVPDREVAAQELGLRLQADVEVDEAQQAIYRAYETLVVGLNPRYSLIEAMSLGEAILFDYVARERTLDPELDARLRRAQRRHRLTFREALARVSAMMSKRGNRAFRLTAALLHQAANRRDKTLHEQAIVSEDEAANALTAVQQLLSYTWSPNPKYSTEGS